MVFLDTRKGRLLRKTWTIHPPRPARQDDFAGAGIWSTPAIDREAKVAYVGTANPFRPQAEHEHANAIVKYDLDRRSREVRADRRLLQGQRRRVLPGPLGDALLRLPRQPAALLPAGDRLLRRHRPRLRRLAEPLHGPDGRKLVGAGQKSGVYHVFDAKTMKPVWTQIVGPAERRRRDRRLDRLRQQVGLRPDHDPRLPLVARRRRAAELGRPGRRRRPLGRRRSRWRTGSSTRSTFTGFLNAYDAAHRRAARQRPLLLGGDSPPRFVGGSQRRPQHRLRRGRDPGPIRGLRGRLLARRRHRRGGDVGEMRRLAAVAVAAAAVAAVATAVAAATRRSSRCRAPPRAATRLRSPASRSAARSPSTTSTSRFTTSPPTRRGRDGRPLFSTPLIGLGETAPVQGLDRVSAGQTYGFFCTLHPGMRGQLAVR